MNPGTVSLLLLWLFGGGIIGVVVFLERRVAEHERCKRRGIPDDESIESARPSKHK